MTYFIHIYSGDLIQWRSGQVRLLDWKRKFPVSRNWKKTGHFLVNSRRISPFYDEIRHWPAQRGPKRKNNLQVYDNGNGHVFFCGSEAELDEADQRFRPCNWPFPGIFPNRFPILDEPIISRNLGTKKSDLAWWRYPCLLCTNKGIYPWFQAPIFGSTFLTNSEVKYVRYVRTVSLIVSHPIIQILSSSFYLSVMSLCHLSSVNYYSTVGTKRTEVWSRRDVSGRRRTTGTKRRARIKALRTLTRTVLQRCCKVLRSWTMYSTGHWTCSSQFLSLAIGNS